MNHGIPGLPGPRAAAPPSVTDVGWIPWALTTTQDSNLGNDTLKLFPLTRPYASTALGVPAVQIGSPAIIPHMGVTLAGVWSSWVRIADGWQVNKTCLIGDIDYSSIDAIGVYNLQASIAELAIGDSSAPSRTLTMYPSQATNTGNNFGPSPVVPRNIVPAGSAIWLRVCPAVNTNGNGIHPLYYSPGIRVWEAPGETRRPQHFVYLNAGTAASASGTGFGAWTNTTWNPVATPLTALPSNVKIVSIVIGSSSGGFIQVGTGSSGSETSVTGVLPVAPTTGTLNVEIRVPPVVISTIINVAFRSAPFASGAGPAHTIVGMVVEEL